MGYTIDFAPTVEVMEKYNIKDSLSFKNEEIQSIILFCLKAHLNNDYTVLTVLNNKLETLATYIENEEYMSIYNSWSESETHTLTYGSLVYSIECDYDKKAIINKTVEMLSILSVIVKTPDFFEDNNNFYKKIDAIKNEIQTYCDIIKEITIHNIINDLSNFKVNNDDMFLEHTIKAVKGQSTLDDEEYDSSFED